MIGEVARDDVNDCAKWPSGDVAKPAEGGAAAKNWIELPVEVLAEAISRLQDGSIVDYRFDPDGASLVKAHKS